VDQQCKLVNFELLRLQRQGPVDMRLTSGHKALERRRGMEGRWRKGEMMPLTLRGRYIFVTIRNSE